jgi:pectate lyase
MGELNALAGGDDPAVIYVSGELSGGLRVGSNKTIIGLPGARINGYMLIGPRTASEAANEDLGDDQEGGEHNIIVKNLTIQGGEDTVNINYSHHIWLDHLDITDGSDGILDIVRASDFITVSWSKIHYYRGGGHRLASLVGNREDLGPIDTGRLRITFHHNWWGAGITGRQPRVRFGKLHLFNNLHTSNEGGYCVRCGVHANIRSERNIYIGQEAFDLTNTTEDAVLDTIEDVFINCSGTVGKGNGAFTPPYQYRADPTDGLRATLEANTGPQ